MKYIPISGKNPSNLQIIVDDEDYDELIKYKWRLTQKGYVIRTTSALERKNGSPNGITIHRHILKLKDPSIAVDHINRNKLDNRKCNLRLCTNQQNNFNTGKYNTNNQYKGVSDSGHETWQAHIRYNNQLITIGSFSDEKIAALAYDQKARELFGEFACLNFPEINDYSHISNYQRINTSRYKGVSWFKPVQKWRARIFIDGKEMGLGYFDDEEEARDAYIKAHNHYRPNKPIRRKG